MLLTSLGIHDYQQIAPYCTKSNLTGNAPDINHWNVLQNLICKTTTTSVSKGNKSISSAFDFIMQNPDHLKVIDNTLEQTGTAVNGCLCVTCSIMWHELLILYMMMAWQANTCHITGHLWEETKSHHCIIQFCWNLQLKQKICMV